MSKNVTIDTVGGDVPKRKRGRPPKRARYTGNNVTTAEGQGLPAEPVAPPTAEKQGLPEAPEVTTAPEQGRKKIRATTPWFRTGPLKVPSEVVDYYKARGMAVRFGTTDRMAERIYQGFEPAKLPDSLKHLAPTQPTILDGVQADGTWKVRGQTLLTIPQEIMDDKKAWLEEQNQMSDNALHKDRDGSYVKEYKTEK